MRELVFLCLILNALFAYADVGDTVTTSKEIVGEIRAQAGGFYYFSPEDGNWSTPECPNANFVYFRDTLTIGQQVYSAALASKISKSPIQFQGVCGDDGGNDRYIKINYMTF